MQVDSVITTWITDYLTGRPQFVRLGKSVSDTVVCSTGAPQGTVLVPFPFPMYTADFQHNSGPCHIQKYSDDMAVVARTRDGLEGEYRNLIREVTSWSNNNCLLLNTANTKELIVDFRRVRTPLQPVNIREEGIEVAQAYK